MAKATCLHLRSFLLWFARRPCPPTSTLQRPLARRRADHPPPATQEAAAPALSALLTSLCSLVPAEPFSVSRSPPPCAGAVTPQQGTQGIPLPKVCRGGISWADTQEERAGGLFFNTEHAYELHRGNASHSPVRQVLFGSILCLQSLAQRRAPCRWAPG